MELLHVEKVSKVFGGLSAVTDVSMTLNSGELVGLIGPNGAGKTTFFNLLTGVYVPTEGDINLMVDGKFKRMNGRQTYKFTQDGVARTFQNIRLFDNLSVLDNVLIAMHARSKETVIGSIFRSPKFHQEEERMTAKAVELLNIFDLGCKKDELAKNLPYGEQRYLEIVRALATEPKVLFLDEPAAGMNPQETEGLTDKIKYIQEHFDITILLIEHDMSLVMRICERIYVLEQGCLIAEGTPEEIRANKRVIAAYLGGDL